MKFEMGSSSLPTSLITFLIVSMIDVLSFFLDVVGLHSLSCVEVFLVLSAIVAVDLDLFDKC